MDFTVLIVDDELEMCQSLSEVLRARDYQTLSTPEPEEVGAIIRENSIDLIIMDIRMPRLSGIDLLKAIKCQNWSIPIIMISGYATVENVVNAMRYGALNFYDKPIRIPKLVREVNRLALMKQARIQADKVQAIDTQNPQMEKVIKALEKVAPTEATILITGESGTGKELVAQQIHNLSPRRDRPFIKLNCAAIPDNLLESELFGHEAGAFTDAKTLRRGKFELADSGSLFFDEIGDMSLKIQAKILRILQEKEYQRLGGSRTLRTDVRLIAATNKELNRLIEQGTFREDLFYRLSVITIELPPLRNRQDDIPLLIDYFIRHFNQIYDKEIQGVSREVMQVLLGHTWPGNVRELRNCLERAAIFGEHKVIEVQDLPNQYQKRLPGGSDPFTKAMESITRQMILDALKNSGGSRQKAAELLHIHRKTLYNKMKKLGIG